MHQVDAILEIVPKNWQAPDPRLSSVLAGIIAALSLAGFYFFFGCSRDWAIVVGLSVDILGAIILAIPDIPLLAGKSYARQLEDARSDISREKIPNKIEPQSKLYKILLTSVTEYVSPHDMPESPIFCLSTEDGKRYLRIKSSCSDKDTKINLAYVENTLFRQAERERGRIRRLGIYLLVLGFGLQILGTLFESMIFPFLTCQGHI